MDTLLSEIQKLVVSSLSGTLAIVAVLSTLHLDVLIAQEVGKPPLLLIRCRVPPSVLHQNGVQYS